MEDSSLLPTIESPVSEKPSAVSWTALQRISNIFQTSPVIPEADFIMACKKIILLLSFFNLQDIAAEQRNILVDMVEHATIAFIVRILPVILKEIESPTSMRRSLSPAATSIVSLLDVVDAHIKHGDDFMLQLRMAAIYQLLHDNVADTTSSIEALGSHPNFHCPVSPISPSRPFLTSSPSPSQTFLNNFSLSTINPQDKASILSDMINIQKPSLEPMITPSKASPSRVNLTTTCALSITPNKHIVDSDNQDPFQLPSSSASKTPLPLFTPSFDTYTTLKIEEQPPLPISEAISTATLAFPRVNTASPPLPERHYSQIELSTPLSPPSDNDGQNALRSTLPTQSSLSSSILPPPGLSDLQQVEPLSSLSLPISTTSDISGRQLSKLQRTRHRSASTTLIKKPESSCRTRRKMRTVSAKTSFTPSLDLSLPLPAWGKVPAGNIPVFKRRRRGPKSDADKKDQNTIHWVSDGPRPNRRKSRAMMAKAKSTDKENQAEAESN